MRTEYENVLKEFMPALRARASRMMVEKRMSQQEIAKSLGVTQAAVSKYLSGKYSKRIKNAERGLDGREMGLFVKETMLGNARRAQSHACRMCSKNLSFRCRLMVR